jgi:drug/metabolite transporter (DMT)-like permease
MNGNLQNYDNWNNPYTNCNFRYGLSLKGLLALHLNRKKMKYIIPALLLAAVVFFAACKKESAVIATAILTTIPTTITIP